MPKTFKRGDHVQWNSEAGIVRGAIIKKITSNVRIGLHLRLAKTLTRQSMTQKSSSLPPPASLAATDLAGAAKYKKKWHPQ